MDGAVFQPAFIINRRHDYAWFLLLPFAAIIFALTAHQHLPGGALVAITLWITVPHFLLTGLRVYGSSTDFERWHERLILGPILLVTAAFLLIKYAPLTLVLLVLLWDNQHSLMQQHGFARIYDFKAKAGAASTKNFDLAFNWIFFGNMLIVSPLFSTIWIRTLYEWSIPIQAAHIEHIQMLSWTIAGLVGMEEFLVRMITDPEFVERAIEVYSRRSLVWIEALLEAGVDAIMTTDDYSDNHGPIMGAERFHRFILPGLRRQCEAIHAHGGYFIKHTDGNTWDILDSFVDIGIDGWHGIQPCIGMDFRLLKERYGDELCLFGGVNCETLIDEAPEAVYEEVRYAITHAARGGGLVIACSNVLQPGTHLKNYLAGRQATRDWGSYPQPA